MPTIEDGPPEPEYPDYEQALTWQALQHAFYGEDQAGLQTRWGRTGMLAVRVGLAGDDQRPIFMTLVNEHHEPGRTKLGFTKITCSWRSASTPFEQIVMVDGRLQDTFLSPDARDEYLGRARRFLDQVRFDEYLTQLAADANAAQRFMTSFVHDTAQVSAEALGDTADIGERRAAIQNFITTVGLLREYPELRREMTFWRYYSSDFNPGRIPNPTDPNADPGQASLS